MFVGRPQASCTYLCLISPFPRYLSPTPPHLPLTVFVSLWRFPVFFPQKIEKMGVNKFNVNPKDGLNFLMEQDFITDTPEGICDFLSIVNGLSKRRLGEYFGRVSHGTERISVWLMFRRA